MEDADQPFLARLYATTRADITSSWLPPEQQRILLEQQFQAQAADYGRNYPAEGHRVVELEDEPVAQGTYQVSHPTLGGFSLFLVPVGPSTDGLLLEAVVNRWLDARHP